MSWEVVSKSKARLQPANPGNFIQTSCLSSNGDKKFEFNDTGPRFKVSGGKHYYNRNPQNDLSFTYHNSIFYIFDELRPNALKYKRYTLHIHGLQWNIPRNAINMCVVDFIGRFDQRTTVRSEWKCCTPKNKNRTFMSNPDVFELFHDIVTDSHHNYKVIQIKHVVHLCDSYNAVVGKEISEINIHYIPCTSKSLETTRAEIRTLQRILRNGLFRNQMALLKTVDIKNLGQNYHVVDKDENKETYETIKQQMK